MRRDIQIDRKIDREKIFMWRDLQKDKKIDRDEIFCGEIYRQIEGKIEMLKVESLILFKDRETERQINRWV